jgi:hypothetical protein
MRELAREGAASAAAAASARMQMQRNHPLMAHLPMEG